MSPSPTRPAEESTVGTSPLKMRGAEALTAEAQGGGKDLSGSNKGAGESEKKRNTASVVMMDAAGKRLQVIEALKLSMAAKLNSNTSYHLLHPIILAVSTNLSIRWWT